mgnify:CR=1 FL=1
MKNKQSGLCQCANTAIKFQNLQKQLAVLKASLAHKKVVTFEDEIKKLDEKIQAKEELSNKLNEEIGAVEGELDKREASIREVASKLIDVSKRVEIEKEVSELRSKLMVTKDRLDSNIREIERLDSLIDKLEALASRKVELSGEAPRSVKTILSLNLRGVVGSVSSLISVPEKYQIAIEVAAGPHLHDIIVENDEVAAYCIGFLKREKIGRATFLPLNKIRPNPFRDAEMMNRHGVVGVASKLIKYDTKLMSAV